MHIMAMKRIQYSPRIPDPRAEVILPFRVLVCVPVLN